ncbi:hypothetical protein jpw_08695 [Pseudomonas asiatica]|uniref:hypothetical protein n=1 Tax=Pseudomonas asiatica TaxID=2219225 RepID=UPI0021F6FC57|nr:hypothetical protein [Pseudomonas asiatica]UYP84239.1 hypothetical protein jpw_08695 [Pseudomonas asiatica]
MRKVSQRVLDWYGRSRRAKAAKQRRVSGVRRHQRFCVSRRHRFSTEKVRLPSTVSLGSTDSRVGLLNAIRKIKDGIHNPEKSKVIIDFSKVTSLHPCGTLLLVAEIERLLQVASNAIKLSATYPTDIVVEQMFQHINLLERLGLEPRIDKINESNVIAWLYATGHEGDLDSIAEKLPRILTEGSNMDLRIALLSGMAEAVANSSEHAYKKTNTPTLVENAPLKWWLFARQFGDDVAFVICDLGRGIPGTLEANWRDELSSFLKSRQGIKRKDHKMIELAFTVGKTSTQKKNRGKGLKDILKVVQEQKVGALSIYSNRGVYALDNATGSLTSIDEKSSIHGTIVQWKIPIEAFGLEVSEKS